MKSIGKLLVIMCCSWALFTSCSKDEEAGIVLNQKLLEGRWVISSVSTPVGLDYPYLQAGDVLYFEDSKKVELVSKMIMAEEYLLDTDKSTFEFTSLLAAIGKFDVKVINEKSIELLPQLFKGTVSLMLSKEDLPQEADLLGKWQLKAMTAYSIQGEEEVIEDLMSKTPSVFTDDLFEYKTGGEVVVWENKDELKANTTAVYSIKGNTILITITQTNRNPYTNEMKLVSIDDKLLTVKISEVNNGVVVTTTNTFTKVQ